MSHAWSPRARETKPHGSSVMKLRSLPIRFLPTPPRCRVLRRSQLHGRHAGCLAGYQIGRPKPCAQRRVRACHDRSNRQSGVTAARAAAQDAGSISEAERLSRRLTMGANEPAAPASLLQVGGAGRVVGKKSLKLWERLWEPKIATLVNVHEHGRTLALVAVGYNRIGKNRSLISFRMSIPQRSVSLTSPASVTGACR